MRKLKEKEVVHCKSVEEIEKTIKELNKQGIISFTKPNPVYIFKEYSINTGISFGYEGCNNIQYSPIWWWKKEGYKVISFDEFFNIQKWIPKYGDKYWVVDYNGNIWDRIYVGNFNDKLSLKYGNCFRTRELARHAKKEIKSLFNNLKYN